MQIAMHGMTIAYEEFGAGPAVLFAGAYSAESDGWRKHVQSLVTAGYRVIIQDFRGVENASALTEDCSAEARSEAVVGLLNYLGIGRAAIVGRSAGDQILQALLRRYPQRVAAVVIAEKVERKNSRGKVTGLKKMMRKQNSDRVVPTDSGTDVFRNLLDLLNKLKQFRPRNPLLLEMA